MRKHREHPVPIPSQTPNLQEVSIGGRGSGGNLKPGRLRRDESPTDPDSARRRRCLLPALARGPARRPTRAGDRRQGSKRKRGARGSRPRRTRRGRHRRAHADDERDRMRTAAAGALPEGARDLDQRLDLRRQATSPRRARNRRVPREERSSRAPTRDHPGARGRNNHRTAQPNKRLRAYSVDFCAAPFGDGANASEPRPGRNSGAALGLLRSYARARLLNAIR